jgi:cytochrome c-type biogenesis protein CcmH
MKWLALFLLLTMPAFAAELSPELEAKAVAIGEGLRCLVCQGESVNDSPAAMAGDMRHLIREKLAAGWDEQKITQYVQGKYGDYILLKPPLKAETYPLWLTPWVVLGACLLCYVAYLKRAKTRQQR